MYKGDFSYNNEKIEGFFQIPRLQLANTKLKKSLQDVAFKSKKKEDFFNADRLRRDAERGVEAAARERHDEREAAGVHEGARVEGRDLPGLPGSFSRRKCCFSFLESRLKILYI